MSTADEVIRAAEQRAAALAEGDAVRLRELLHEDFLWTTHVGTTFDRAEYVRRNTQGVTTWRSQTLSDPRVVVHGQTAVLHAQVSDVVLGEDGRPETHRMPVTQVWVCDDAGWTCLAGHAGPRL